MMKKRKNRFARITAAIFAAVFMMPSIAYAEPDEKAVQQIHHVHIGSEEEGGACYEEEVKHVHQGDEEKGGSCFRSPVYHVHDGNTEEGGECYQTKIYHVHEGTQEEGKGCYGQPVYHAHAGSAATGGGCYGKPVYHKHTGSGSAGGGCYGKPVYHKHAGSQAGKGGCYGTPVYHAHTGSQTAGGGCYRIPVYHSHAGDETSGGACYEPVYHQHTDACYQEARCEMEYVGNMQTQREESGYCYHHGNVLVIHFRANFRHQSCGRGIAEDGNSTCWTCQIMNSWHTYNKIVCGKDDKTVEGYRRVCGKETGTVESWALGCGKNEASVEKYALSCGKDDKTVESYQINCNKNDKTVDSYQTNCNKTEKSIEKYAQNCGKTTEDIDSYSMNCTKDEKTIDSYTLSCDKTEETTDSYALSCKKDGERGLAEFSVSNQDRQWTGGDVTLRASLQDPDGFLQLPPEPFMWEGEGIRQILSHEVKVKENGVYVVHLKAENEDVDKTELVLSIEVKNIDKTPPVIEKIAYTKETGVKSNLVCVTAKDLQPDGSPGSGLAAEAYSFDGGRTWQKENTFALTKNGILPVAVRDCCGNVSVQDVEISNIKEEEEDSGNNEEEDGNQKEDIGNGSGGAPGENQNGGGEDGPQEDNNTDKENTDKENTDKENTDKENTDKENIDKENTDKENTDEENTDKENTDKENTDKGNTGEENTDKGTTGKKNSNKPDEGKKDTGEKDKEGDKTDREETVKETGILQKRANVSRRAKTDGKEKGEIDGKGRKGPENRAETEKRKITLPEKREEYQEETVEIEIPKTGAKPEGGSRPGVLARAETVGKVVKAVTFTVSGIMLASGLIYLIYLMFRSIQVFDCDGEGNARYAGSCIMKKTEDGFEVRIPNMIWERSATGQYSLRPGKIFARKNKGKELIVMAGENKESVWIDKEIPLRITMYV